MFLVKIHKSHRDVLAVCDSNLVGKRFENDQIQLEVKENFYSEEEISQEELREVMRDMAMEDATFNIVGEESIKIALEEGIIDEKSIKTIEKVPFSLVLL